ncbi:MAG: inositol monophosphatase family protein [Pseudomonadota bacterium]
MNISQIKRTGIAAAYKGGAILKANFGKTPKITKKGAIDLVTESDIESEKVIIETIKNKFPSHAVLAEESGLEKGDEEGLWIIDPLDGTTNFAHHLPIFAVSIAFALKGDIVAGIVFNPVTGELYTAAKGEGAFLNGIPIHVSTTEKLSDSLLVTGFPYNFKEMIGDIKTRFFNCLMATQGVRRLGSAALDLCYTAAGRFEGFFEQELKPWDTAAGLIIAKEAGGSVTDFSGNSFDIYQPEILATNGKIHDEILKLLELKG